MDKVLVVGEALTKDSDLRRVIEREGFTVTRAEGRDAALRVLAAEQPAVAIIEHDPGEVFGLLRDVRTALPTCEVALVVSDGGDTDLAIDALRAGALDYLRRPLDLEQVSLALGRAKERWPQRQAQQPPTILLLEDHEPTRRRLGAMLEKEGYLVRAAADGEEGLALFRSQRVDLIIADLKMPRRDGLEVLRATKGQGADVEVILVTGHGNEETVVEALRAGAADFLRKPIDLEEMLQAITRALEAQKLRRSLAYRNREAAIVEEHVLRLTRKLELVVETWGALGASALGLLARLGDALPVGLVVAAGDGTVLFVNRHITERLGRKPQHLSAEWLALLGLRSITRAAVDEAVQRALRSGSGSFEQLVLSEWASLLIAPVTLVRANGTQRVVALVMRGERSGEPPRKE